MVEEAVEEDTVHVEGNVQEVESDVIYVDRMFNDENEAYDAYNSHPLGKGFGVFKGELLNLEQTRRYYGCNLFVIKEGQRKSDKRLAGQDVLFPRDIHCDYIARMKIVLNDMGEWVLVKFIAEHNYPL